MKATEAKYPLIGLAGVVAFAAVVALCLALYTQVFVSSVPVTLLASRAGLLMDPGAAVKLNGVVVGRVDQIRTDGDGAALDLGLDPSLVAKIPSDVSASIVPPTVFGAKYVQLIPTPSHSPIEPISAGQVIDRSHVTVEINTAFANVIQALDAMPAVKLNAALSSVAGALEGRGAALGKLLVSTNTYLRQLNPSLPDLTKTIPLTTQTANLYADVTPDLVHTLSNAGDISNTVVDKQAQLSAFLLSLTRFGTTTTDFLKTNQNGLVTTLDVLRPTLGLLGRYSPILPCLLGGVVNNDQYLRAVIGGPTAGGTHPNANVKFTVERSLPAYQNPGQLPKVATTNPPDCYGLPRVSGYVPYHAFNTGADAYGGGTEGGVQISQTPLGLALFGVPTPTPTPPAPTPSGAPVTIPPPAPAASSRSGQ